MTAQPPLARDETPFQIRGHSFTVLTLHIVDPFDVRFFSLLRKAIGQAPDFYRNAPVVLDLSALEENGPFELGEFCQRLKQHDLLPVGIRNANDIWVDAAHRLGLAVFPQGKPASVSSTNPPPTSASPSPRPTAKPMPLGPLATTTVITEAVRSGQQVVVKKGDVIVLAPVSHGAELLVEGNIHVYSTLHGRAVAGMNGNRNARIFVSNLNADLVSIAGYYLAGEQIPQSVRGRPVHIRLDGERLSIDPL